MANIEEYFSEEEVRQLVYDLLKEGAEIEQQRKRFDIYEKRLQEAKLPFLAKQKELQDQKRREGKEPILSVEERDEIWHNFPAIRRKLEKDIYG